MTMWIWGTAAVVYVSGAFLDATPRDWARFGLLYLNEWTEKGGKLDCPPGPLAKTLTADGMTLALPADGPEINVPE